MKRIAKDQVLNGIKASNGFECLTDKTKFFDTDHDPEQALLLYCANSGAYQFQDVNKLNTTDPVVRHDSIKKTELCLVAAKIKEEEQHDLLRYFYHVMGQGGFDVDCDLDVKSECGDKSNLYEGSTRSRGDSHLDLCMLRNQEHVTG